MCGCLLGCYYFKQQQLNIIIIIIIVYYIHYIPCNSMFYQIKGEDGTLGMHSKILYYCLKLCFFMCTLCPLFLFWLLCRFFVIVYVFVIGNMFCSLIYYIIRCPFLWYTLYAFKHLKGKHSEILLLLHCFILVILFVFVSIFFYKNLLLSVCFCLMPF